MNVTGVWSAAEVESYLREATVPLRLACRTPGGSLWMLSLWFLYRDGALWCATSAEADVVEYLTADGDVAFEVSTNEPPYRGVRGNGTATVTPDEDKELLRALLDRYLGGTDSPLARRLLADERDEVRLRLDPAKCYTWDFAERMRESLPAGEPTPDGTDGRDAADGDRE